MALVYIVSFIFLFNLVPAFAPPTWMLLSYMAVKYHPHILILVVGGAVAATLGRLVLARLSKVIVRDQFLSAGTIQNIDTVKAKLSEHKRFTFGLFLFYAFSPFPSNQLFMAYGLTDLPLSVIALPFFLGRLVSYAFWVMAASEVSKHIAVDSLRNGKFFTTYFLILQIATLVVVYIFIKIDWNKLFTERKLGWVNKKL